ncbi:hypothetical protein GCM10027082_06820 [Comamonas humi]
MLVSLLNPHWPGRWWRTAQRWAVAWWRILYLGAVAMVLLLSPSSYGRQTRLRLMRRMYLDTAPILLGFTALSALLCLVVAHIVNITARSYGLSRFALEMVIRVLVLELIPLTAALFVAMRCTIPAGARLTALRESGRFAQLRQQGVDPVRAEMLPLVVSGMYAAITLAALSCVVALVMVYLSVYGFSLAGAVPYTRSFARVFTPSVTLLFMMKTLMFSLVVALIPTASAMHRPYGMRAGAALGPESEISGLARMFVVLLLIEILSLMGNYY